MISRAARTGCVGGCGGERGIRGWCTRGAIGEGCGEHFGGGVVVVVHFSGGLAGEGPGCPAGVLDETSFERDRRGEEQGVQGGQSKPSRSRTRGNSQLAANATPIMMRSTRRVCSAASSPLSGCHSCLRAALLKRVDSRNGWAGLTRDIH